MRRWGEWLRRHWWVVPIAIFIAARLFSGILLMMEADRQIALVPSVGELGPHISHAIEASPSYSGVLTNWDGQWYWQVADHGYPHTLPRDSSGVVQQNTWNFYPMLPVTARLVSAVSPLGFPWAAACVSLVAAGIGIVILYRWLQTSSNTFNAFTATLALSMHPGAYVFQIAYAEGLAFLFLMIALRALSRRKYLAVAISCVLLGLTRPVGLPLVLVIGVHGLLRWRERGVDPFGPRERLKVLVTGVVAGASFFLWPAITGWVVGDWQASQETRQAWALGGPWITWLSTIARGNPLLAVVAIILLLILADVLLNPRARAWPTELRWWSGTYAVYIAAVAQATFIPIRYALLMPIPWWPFPLQRNPRPAVWALVGAIIVLIGGFLQWWDIHTFYIMAPNTRASI